MPNSDFLSLATVFFYNGILNKKNRAAFLLHNAVLSFYGLAAQISISTFISGNPNAVR